MAEVPLRRRFQFSLRTLFCWMLALSVQFGLATLPWPINGYFAPLYASALAGYVGARSPWLAALLGGASSLAASYLMMAVEANRHPAPQAGDMLLIPWVAGCCCLPGGAYVGLAAGLLTADYRKKRRFKSRLESLWREIANPGASSKTPDEPAAPDPQAQRDADD